MKSAKKPEEKKTVAAVSPAEKTVAAKEPAKAAAETKTAAAKPAAKKTAAAAKKPAAKKTAAKPAAKKPAAKSAAKPAAKTAAKSAAKSTAKKPAAKKAVKKAPAVTVDTICKKLEKKINKTKAAAVKGKVAVDIEVWGFEDGSNAKMYIEVNDGKVTVSPHTYEAKDFRVSLSCANALAFVDGKLTLKALLESNDFYAEGNIAPAVKLAAIF